MGRNIEDSDADLYAEYHGAIESRSSSEASLVDLRGAGEGDGVRIRRGNVSLTDTGSGRGKRLGHSRRTSRRYQDFMPDLSSSINTEFSSMDPQMQSTSSAAGYDFKSWFEGQ